jgi:23S rRNA (uracil1939-C5)-methyltransferase
MSTTYEVKLTTPTYGGDSLGRLPDGRAVFVPYTQPGELVRVRLSEEKKNFARGALLEVLEASPERTQPRCSHFNPQRGDRLGCGGCHYQHIPYEVQLRMKEAILKDQLERIGKLEDPQVASAVPSSQPWNYRNHVQFHLSPTGELGFQAPRSQEMVPIRECHLPKEVINDLWPRLDIESVPGLDRLGIRSGSGDDLMLVLESSDPEPVSLSLDLPISVVHLGPGGHLVLAGDDHIVIEVEGAPFRVSPGSFFQVNTAAAAEMVGHLLDKLPLTGETTLVEAYCGVGLFSAFLAPHVGRLVGIEAFPSACEDFVLNLDEFDNVELYESPVEKALPALDLKPDIILVDPPRSGLDRRVVDGILALAPRHLAYVSCDPSTLARDAKRLAAGGYESVQVTPFDLFPQTYHIESVSFWVKDRE